MLLATECFDRNISLCPGELLLQLSPTRIPIDPPKPWLRTPHNLDQDLGNREREKQIRPTSVYLESLRCHGQVARSESLSRGIITRSYDSAANDYSECLVPT